MKQNLCDFVCRRLQQLMFSEDEIEISSFQGSLQDSLVNFVSLLKKQLTN